MKKTEISEIINNYFKSWNIPADAVNITKVAGPDSDCVVVRVRKDEEQYVIEFSASDIVNAPNKLAREFERAKNWYETNHYEKFEKIVKDKHYSSPAIDYIDYIQVAAILLIAVSLMGSAYAMRFGGLKKPVDSICNYEEKQQ